MAKLKATEKRSQLSLSFQVSADLISDSNAPALGSSPRSRLTETVSESSPPDSEPYVLRMHNLSSEEKGDVWTVPIPGALNAMDGGEHNQAQYVVASEPIAVDMGGGKGGAHTSQGMTAPLTTSAAGHAVTVEDLSPTLPAGRSGPGGQDSRLHAAVIEDRESTPTLRRSTPPAAAAGAVPDAFQEPMFSAEDFPARTSRWLVSVLAWLREPGQDFSTSSCASLLSSLPVGFSSRTSLGFCRPAVALSAEPPSAKPTEKQATMALETEPSKTRKRPLQRSSPTIAGVTWRSSSGRWGTSGMGTPTGCLTLSTSEWPSAAVVCSLSAVLETGPLPPRFYLSPRAAKGILHRAERRGKVLPPALREALMATLERSA